MGRLAVVGKNLLGTDFAAAARRVDAGGGAAPGVAVLDAGDFVVLARHGLDRYVQPHRIDHVANLRALATLGCDRVLAIGSVGSLRNDWPVGTFVAPDDFVALTSRPVAATDDGRAHAVAAFDPAWRGRVLSTWTEPTDGRRDDGPVDEPVGGVVDGGVYWETTGPRFETPAEIRLLATFADVVGMTIGSECAAAGQLGLAYAAVCVVDNLANGLGAAPLTMTEFEAGAAANRARLLRELARVVPALAS